MLSDFRGNAGLSLQWVLFGSSGHVSRPTPGGPLAHYHKCTGELSYQMKCMANMFHAADHMMVGNTVHDCTYRCALLRTCAWSHASHMSLEPPPSTARSSLQHVPNSSDAFSYSRRRGGYRGQRRQCAARGEGTCRLEDGDVSEPAVTTSDGSRLEVFANTPMTNPHHEPALGESRTYLGHLNNKTYDATITPQHRLALFHYVTRSLEDYTTRKVKLPSGIYTHNYVRMSKKSDVSMADKDVMAKYEHANGFDGTAPICSSVPKNFYVGQCCSGAA